jgi:hypothetical protein
LGSGHRSSHGASSRIDTLLDVVCNYIPDYRRSARL